MRIVVYCYVFQHALIVAGYILLTQNKGNIHISINRFHSPFFDLFFKKITYFGNGIFVVIVSGLLLFLTSLKNSLFIACSNILAGLVSQLLKRLVFPAVLRPSAFFEGKYNLHIIEGVDLHSSFSFPSGHAATAFSVFFGLAVLTKNKLLKFCCLILAMLVSFSRVYISQHFLIDIWAGSFIGIVTCFVFYFLIMQSGSTWLNKNLIKSRKYASEK